jgi:hypothetical protein
VIPRPLQTQFLIEEIVFMRLMRNVNVYNPKCGAEVSIKENLKKGKVVKTGGEKCKWKSGYKALKGTASEKDK